MTSESYSSFKNALFYIAHSCEGRAAADIARAVLRADHIADFNKKVQPAPEQQSASLTDAVERLHEYLLQPDEIADFMCTVDRLSLKIVLDGLADLTSPPLPEQAAQAIERFREEHGNYAYADGAGLYEDAEVILAHIDSQAQRIAELEARSLIPTGAKVTIHTPPPDAAVREAVERLSAGVNGPWEGAGTMFADIRTLLRAVQAPRLTEKQRKAVKMAMEIGDQCSRGYLARLHNVLRAAFPELAGEVGRGE